MGNSIPMRWLLPMSPHAARMRQTAATGDVPVLAFWPLATNCTTHDALRRRKASRRMMCALRLSRVEESPPSSCCCCCCYTQRGIVLRDGLSQGWKSGAEWRCADNFLDPHLGS